MREAWSTWLLGVTIWTIALAPWMIWRSGR